METLSYSVYESVIGPLVIGASHSGLVLVEFVREAPRPSPRAITRNAAGDKSGILWEENEKATRPYVRQLEEYFAGKRCEFTCPLDMRGTEFQKRCWRELVKIAYGETLSYRELAARVGTAGFRAVGAANGANPISIIVPCHRVIASNGTLWGYGGGLDRKRRLLDMEGALTPLLVA